MNSAGSVQQGAQQVKKPIMICDPKVAEALRICKAKFDQGMQACGQAGGTALNEQNQGVEEKQVADRKKADAVEEKKVGDQLIKSGEQLVNVDQAEADSRIEGGLITKQYAQRKQEQAEAEAAKALALQQSAAAAFQLASDMMVTLQAEHSKNEGTLNDLQQAVGELRTWSDDTLKHVNPASVDQPNPSKKPSSDPPGKSTPGSPKGQGAGPGKSDGSPSSQAKKNDEGQGGNGPGGGPGGSPSSSPSSSPLKVADAPKDCSNPSVAASNPVCACRLNPSDSRCSSILAADRERREGPAKKPKVIDGEEGGGGGGSSFNGTGPQSAAQKAAISKHGQLEQNGGGSSGKGVGSGMSGASANNSKNDSKVNLRDQKPTSSKGGGTYGGGGSAVSAGYHPGAPNRKIPNTFAASGNSMGRNPASVTRAPTAAELRAQAQNQFNALRRGPSGSGSMIGVDGISGPHTDQFKKIRVRYADAFGL